MSKSPSAKMYSAIHRKNQRLVDAIYRLSNPELGKKERRKYDPSLPKKFVGYRTRAENKSIPFELTVEQFNNLLLQDCEYCGVPTANGVDRIDNSLGYITENVTPCCRMCNTMKFTYTRGEFLAQVERIKQNCMGD